MPSKEARLRLEILVHSILPRRSVVAINVPRNKMEIFNFSRSFAPLAQRFLTKSLLMKKEAQNYNQDESRECSASGTACFCFVLSARNWILKLIFPLHDATQKALIISKRRNDCSSFHEGNFTYIFSQQRLCLLCIRSLNGFLITRACFAIKHTDW